MKSKTSLLQKLLLIAFGILCCAFLIEIGLRLAGSALSSLQEYRNYISVRQNGTYRIMCLGESTTQGQYPPFLEEILNQRNTGIRFSVIDKGLGGAVTSALVNNTESYLDAYHPDMVVVMMGINDYDTVMPYEAPSSSKTALFFRSLKTYKLIRILWLHMVTKVREIGLLRNKSGSLSAKFAGPVVKESGTTMSKEEAFKKAIGIEPDDYLEYIKLGRTYNSQGKFTQAEETFNEGIEFSLNNIQCYYELGRKYMYQGRFSEAEALFKKGIELNPNDDKFYGLLALMYERKGKIPLANKYYSKSNEIIKKQYNPTVIYNYRNLKEILDKRNIKLVCVQYPIRSLEPLQNIFEEQAEIIFVDNDKIFKDAINKESYQAYFRDTFGGDFGHCTPKGNRLLAENIANTILRKYFHK